jgi:hypothetical protein
VVTAERDFDPLRALLTPEDAAQAEEPGWSVSTPADGLPSPLLDPCGDGQVPGSDAVASVAERAMSSEREAGGSLLQQVVYEFRDIASADQAFTAYREAYERCPASPSGESYYEEVQPAEDLSFLSGERLLVRQTSCPPGCNAPFASYAYVVRNTYAVTVARYEVGEDGDPAEPGRQLLRAVALAMNGAVYESTPVLGIRSPAGSTTCVLYVTGVACDTAAQFTPPPKPADCEFDWGSRVELDDEGARFSCHSDALGVEETASLLPYGATAQNEAFRCSSSTEGITCRQVAGDAGFRLSRGSYELFQG